MSMLTIFESRYTLKGRYSIGNVGKTASMSVLTLFEPRYTSPICEFQLSFKSDNDMTLFLYSFLLRRIYERVLFPKFKLEGISLFTSDKIVPKEDWYNNLRKLSYQLYQIIFANLWNITLFDSLQERHC